MKLTEICIRRPVLATVLSLLLLFLGLQSIERLQLRHYPKIDQPRVSVITQFEGASPEIIETQITKPLENALSSIEGIDSMTSRNGSGESAITLTFRLDRDIDAAANDVREKVSRARSKFPPDIQNTVIRKADADAIPMMYLVLYSDRHELKDVSDYARNTLESQLQTVSGVAAVDTWGGGDYRMYIRLDPIKMAAFQVSPEEVAQALKQQTFEKPAGSLITEDRQITVTTKATLKTEEEFRSVVVEERDGYLVRISDIAEEVKFDAVEEDFRVRFNGKEAVSLAITRQSTANDLDISRDINELLTKVRQNLPQGMEIEIAKDNSIFIDKSLQKVRTTIYEAAALVILVIFFFLRSFRASIVPIVTIPLSLIGVCAIMAYFGFTINVLTLLALVMAIGLVVDDAIVMLENIYRYIEKGMKPLDAALKGSKEISYAVIAMTITLAAVYAPVALYPGITGKIFTEFAITLAGAVILSGFFALTLSPMMCALFLRHHEVVDLNKKDSKGRKQHYSLFQRVDAWIEGFLHWLDDAYARSLDAIPRWLVILTAAFMALLTVVLWSNVKQDLSTAEDQGYVKARAFPPQGASLKFINKYMEQAEDIFAGVPEIEKRLTLIQAKGDSTIENYLVPWEMRSISSMDLSRQLRPKFNEITGMSFAVWGRGRSLTGGGGRGKPIEINVQTTKSYDELVSLFNDYVSELRKIEGIDKDNIEDTLSSEEQEIVIKIDRKKAAFMKIDLNRVGELLDTLIGGRPATYFEKESFRYPVSVELAERFRQTKEDISALFIKAQRDNKVVMIPLSEIVTIEKQLVPTEIYHTSGLRSATVYAELLPGYDQESVLTKAMNEARRVLPEGSKIEFAGESKRFMEESANILKIFLAALISIYLVLSAQYESFLDPLIIMFSVPLSLVGGLLGLMILGADVGWTSFTFGTMTIFGQIGLVTLIGLITKHGILIVEFANQLVEEGRMKRAEAAMHAARVRLRPILMTTFAMVLGAVPLAYASGAGHESLNQIGHVIVGGMTIGTLFTLYVVPTVYVYLSKENIYKVFGMFKSAKA
ncbi:MAG: efflux RND transporter permease subunit [Alphaproteobacteria bacterium]